MLASTPICADQQRLVANRASRRAQRTRLQVCHTVAPRALQRHHRSDVDFSQQQAKMVRHPSEPNVWSNRTLSTDNWVSTTAAGAINDVPPGRTVFLAVSTKVQFG